MNTAMPILQFFADFICKELGIVYQEANFYQLETRLQKIATQLGHASVEDMHKAASSHMDASMRMLLLDTATNNETSFFRDPGVFESFRQYLNKREFMYEGRREPLRIWSAACSYGQEPYSLTMILEENRDKLPASGYEIVATDISQQALSAAKKGTFSQLQVQRGLPAAKLIACFDRAGDEHSLEWQVKPHLQSHIQFKTQNLLHDFASLGTFDVVFCRNVLIYQSVDRKKAIIGRIYDVMKPNGFLVLGAAESLIGINDKLVMQREGNATFYRKVANEVKLTG